MYPSGFLLGGFLTEAIRCISTICCPDLVEMIFQMSAIVRFFCDFFRKGRGSVAEFFQIGTQNDRFALARLHRPEAKAVGTRDKTNHLLLGLSVRVRKKLNNVTFVWARPRHQVRLVFAFRTDVIKVARPVGRC